MKKYAVEYKLQVPMGGVRLTGGRFQRVFENNVAFLKGFDLDRMLYWYRVHKGKTRRACPMPLATGTLKTTSKGKPRANF